MRNFKQAIKWLKERKKVRRPSWGVDSFWILGIDESILWADGTHARIHLNHIDATDWEVYEGIKVPDMNSAELKQKASKLIKDARKNSETITEQGWMDFLGITEEDLK